MNGNEEGILGQPESPIMAFHIGQGVVSKTAALYSEPVETELVPSEDDTNELSETPPYGPSVVVEGFGGFNPVVRDGNGQVEWLDC